jgi:hypothetical protein
MKRVLSVIVVLLLVICPVLATKAKVTVIDEESYSGAVLKLGNPSTGAFGDKIYPSLVGKGIGLIEFDIETLWPEVNLKLLLLNGGEVVLSLEDGPFQVNGSRITIDLREKIETVEELITEVVNESEEPIVNETLNEDLDLVGEDEEELVESSSDGITGRIVSGGKNIFTGDYGLFAMIGFGVLAGGLLIFFVVRMAYKSGAKAELKELGRMEIDRRIDNIDKD